MDKIGISKLQSMSDFNLGINTFLASELDTS